MTTKIIHYSLHKGTLNKRFSDGFRNGLKMFKAVMLAALKQNTLKQKATHWIYIFLTRSGLNKLETHRVES